MAKVQVRVNSCGVPETEWVNGVCKCLTSTCSMEGMPTYEKRAYDYAQKHFGLHFGNFDPDTLRQQVEASPKVFSIPKYFRSAISCEGQTFTCLQDFPINTPMRVCHDGKDGALLVGMVCWRKEPASSELDGITIWKGASCLDTETCSYVLRGAMFEPAEHNLNYYNN